MFDDVLVCVLQQQHRNAGNFNTFVFLSFFFADGKIVRLLSVECRVDWGEWNGF